MATRVDSPPRSLSRPINWAGPLPSRYLMAGTLHASDEACVVNTVLGSCVAVTMLHAKTGLAAICHAMLPTPRSAADAVPDAPDRFKYASVVVPAMFDFFLQHGIAPHQLEVKLFGGANVLQQPDEPWIGTGVGQANVLMTRRLLDGAGAHVHGSDVGGANGRKILFNTLSGRVLLRYIDSVASRVRAIDR